MKQKLILFICLFGMVQLSAQISENVRFGFKLAPHVSWLTTDVKQISSGSSSVGMTVGTVGEYYLNENYVLTTGIGITFNQGGELNHRDGGRLFPEAELSEVQYDSLPGGSDITYKMRYLEIPFGFRMRTREFGKWRLTFEAPIITFNFKMRARADINGPGIDATEGENINPEMNLLNLSYGVSAGGEYSLSDDISILVAIEYRQGFLDVTKDQGVLSNGDIEDSVGTTGFVALKAGILF